MATQGAWFSAAYHLCLIKIPSHLSIGQIQYTVYEAYSVLVSQITLILLIAMIILL